MGQVHAMVLVSKALALRVGMVPTWFYTTNTEVVPLCANER